VDVIDHTRELGGPIAGLVSFTRDLAGELYLVAHDGDVYRLAFAEPAAIDVVRGQ
jgi:hypothetical protein